MFSFSKKRGKNSDQALPMSITYNQNSWLHPNTLEDMCKFLHELENYLAADTFTSLKHHFLELIHINEMLIKEGSYQVTTKEVKEAKEEHRTKEPTTDSEGNLVFSKLVKEVNVVLGKIQQEAIMLSSQAKVGVENNAEEKQRDSQKNLVLNKLSATTRSAMQSNKLKPESENLFYQIEKHKHNKPGYLVARLEKLEREHATKSWFLPEKIESIGGHILTVMETAKSNILKYDADIRPLKETYTDLIKLMENIIQHGAYIDHELSRAALKKAMQEQGVGDDELGKKDLLQKTTEVRSKTPILDHKNQIHTTMLLDEPSLGVCLQGITLSLRVICDPKTDEHGKKIKKQSKTFKKDKGSVKEINDIIASLMKSHKDLKSAAQIEATAAKLTRMDAEAKDPSLSESQESDSSKRRSPSSTRHSPTSGSPSPTLHHSPRHSHHGSASHALSSTLHSSSTTSMHSSASSIVHPQATHFAPDSSPRSTSSQEQDLERALEDAEKLSQLENQILSLTNEVEKLRAEKAAEESNSDMAITQALSLRKSKDATLALLTSTQEKLAEKEAELQRQIAAAQEAKHAEEKLAVQHTALTSALEQKEQELKNQPSLAPIQGKLSQAEQALHQKSLRVVALEKQVDSQKRKITNLSAQEAPCAMCGYDDGLSRNDKRIRLSAQASVAASPLPRKTPWWKYGLAILGILAGTALIVTGAGAIGGGILLGISFGGIAGASLAVAGGGTATLGGIIYTTNRSATDTANYNTHTTLLKRLNIPPAAESKAAHTPASPTNAVTINIDSPHTLHAGNPYSLLPGSPQNKTPLASVDAASAHVQDRPRTQSCGF